MPSKNIATHVATPFTSAFCSPSRNGDSFVVTLKSQAIHCKFGDAADDLVWDRLVVGIRYPFVWKELLRDPDLTLQKADEIAHVWEQSETEATAMLSYTPLSLLAEEGAMVHRLEVRRSSTMSLLGSPYPLALSARTVTHLIAVLLQTEKSATIARTLTILPWCAPRNPPSIVQNPQPKAPIPQAKSKISVVNKAVADDITMLHLCRIEANLSKVWYISLGILNLQVCFKLDTGAECNVIARHVFINPFPHPALCPSRTRLRAFNSVTVIMPLGEITVLCRFNNQVIVVSFLVVRSDVARGTATENLIGRPTIEQHGLVLCMYNICAMDSLNPPWSWPSLPATVNQF